MTLFRSEAQVALNDLLVACQKSVDHYRDTAAYLAGANASSMLLQLAEQRQSTCEQLEQAVRQQGDLPSVPDADRETIESLYHRVHASLAADDERAVLEQHLTSEQKVAEQVADLVASGQLQEQSDLLHEVLKQSRAAEARLREMLTRHST